MGQSTPTRFSQRIFPSLAVLCLIGATCVVVAIPLHSLGKQIEDDRLFLKNYRSPDIWELEVAVRMNYVVESHEKNDVLFLGDSSCYFGVSPLLFTQYTGLQAYNLGTPGARIPRTFDFILRRYLENHPKPLAIVVCYAPHWIGTMDPRPPHDRDIDERMLWCYGRGTAEDRPSQKTFLYTYIEAGGRYLAGELLGGLQPQLDKPIQGYPHPDATYNKQKRLREEARGYFECTEQSWYPSLFNLTRDPPFSINAVNKAAIIDFARVCAEKGIVLLYRISPCYEEIAPETWPLLIKDVDELETSTSGVVAFSRPLVLFYRKEWMTDNRHCNDKGAEQYTRLVAEEVKRILKK